MMVLAGFAAGAQTSRPYNLTGLAVLSNRALLESGFTPEKRSSSQLTALGKVNPAVPVYGRRRMRLERDRTG